MRLRKTREQHKLTQIDLAKRMGSSQSRVAKNGSRRSGAYRSTCWSKGYWRRELPGEKLRPHLARARRLHPHNVPAFSCGRQKRRRSRRDGPVCCNALLAGLAAGWL